LRGEAKQDRRMQKTRHAIRSAFVQLVFERRYEDIAIADIIRMANVGRSTFYLHFESKDDLLKSVVEWTIDELAASVRPDRDPERLRKLIAHFWEKRRLGSLIFNGPVSPALRRQFVSKLEAEGGLNRLWAIQVAAAHFGMLHAWLSGEVAATPDEIVAALNRMSHPVKLLDDGTG
jgi:AcrR family transcriptional regulator